MGRHTGCGCILLIGLLRLIESTLAVCGTSVAVTSESENIASPFDRTGRTYPSSAHCSWKVQAPRGKHVKLTQTPKTTFSLESEGTNCPYDYVVVYDGENDNAVILGRFCGEFPTDGVKSSGNSLFVVFHTDASVEHSGFQLSVQFVGACGGRLIGRSGRLTSPGYGSQNYPNNAECTWVIDVWQDKCVQLEFSSFHLEDDSDCMFDSVNIYDGRSKASPKLGSFCGRTVPGQIESTGRFLLVEFLSDDSETEQGFAASYTILETACGIQDSEFRPNFARIVGGREANLHSWPWQVSLRKHDSYICGGSIISKRYVVTAAHCIHRGTASWYSIVAGDHIRNISEGTEQTITVAAITKHKAYRHITSGNDIAVLHLAEDIRYTRYVKPICLTREDAPTGTSCFTTGWGATLGTGNNNVLNEVGVPIIDRAFCRRRNVYGASFTNTMICAGYPQGGKDSCWGDSGGPLVCRKNGVFRLYGITSWGGHDCAVPRKPGVYTRVARFVDWINVTTSGAFSQGPP